MGQVPLHLALQIQRTMFCLVLSIKKGEERRQGGREESVICGSVLIQALFKGQDLSFAPK